MSPANPSNAELHVLIVTHHKQHDDAHMRHTKLLEALQGQVAALSVQLRVHDEQDQLVENRVLKLETRHEIEKEFQEHEATVNRRVSGVIAASVSIIAQIAKEAWTFYHPQAG
jgi:hypothetical protein